MSEPVTFVDTNVLVYAHDASNPVKHRLAAAFVATLWADRAAVVSTQILAELYSVLTRKVRLAPAAARRVVVLYTAWPIVEIDVSLLAAAMLRSEQDGVAWWDRVMAYARSFCPPNKASKAVGRIKRAVQTGWEVPLESALALERELQQQLFESDDAKEGIAAYNQKRKPQFSGR